MAKARENDLQRSVVTTVPVANSNADVKATAMPMMPPNPFGTICKVRGTVLPGGTYFYGLSFKVGRGMVTYTKEQVAGAPDAFLGAGAIYGSDPFTISKPWSMDGTLLADCGPLTGQALKDNTLYVVATSYNYDPMNPMNPYAILLEDTSTPFKGKSVTACAGEGVVVAGAEVAKSQGGPAGPGGTIDGEHAAPIDSDGDWLFYGGLSVSNPFFGNRVYRLGNPLRARVLAVAAADVNWSYEPFAPLGVGRRHVRRAVGDLTFESFPFSPWRFPKAPQNSIVVWQNRLGLPINVVQSECRQDPDFIHVNPDEDILVQVNYHALFQASLKGSFGLWVKVID